jgi:hypothetical protein
MAGLPLPANGECLLAETLDRVLDTITGIRDRAAGPR